MTWLYLAAGSVIFFTTLNLLQRLISTDSKNPRATAVIFNSYAAAISLIIFFVTGKFRDFALPADTSPWIFLLVACAGYATYERLRFAGAKLLDASVYATLSTVGVVVAFFTAAILYKESLTLDVLLGFLLIIVAIVLVSYTQNNSGVSLKALALAIFSFVALGIGWSLDKKGTLFFTPDTYSIFIWTIPIILIYLPYVPLKDLKNEAKTGGWKVLALAFLNVVGYLIQLKAQELADATKVIPIVQTSIIFTVILGILILKERTIVARKITAGVLAVLGVILLV